MCWLHYSNLYLSFHYCNHPYMAENKGKNDRLSLTLFILIQINIDKILLQQDKRHICKVLQWHTRVTVTYMYE